MKILCLCRIVEVFLNLPHRTSLKQRFCSRAEMRTNKSQYKKYDYEPCLEMMGTYQWSKEHDQVIRDHIPVRQNGLGELR